MKRNKWRMKSIINGCHSAVQRLLVSVAVPVMVGATAGFLDGVI